MKLISLEADDEQNQRQVHEFSSMALTLLITVLPVSGGASAKEHKVKGSDNPAHVVAHILFSGLSAVDMTMQKKVNDKYYLYVQHSKDQGISIVDISRPAQPKAAGLIPWPDPAVSSRMSLTGDLAIIAESEPLSMRRGTANDDLVLWDLSNPTAPRVVQRFSGVVKWLQDERNFILNSDGYGWFRSQPIASRNKLRPRSPLEVEVSNGNGSRIDKQRRRPQSG